MDRKAAKELVHIQGRLERARRLSSAARTPTSPTPCSRRLGIS